MRISPIGKRLRIRSAGFTLLEMLVAISISGIILVAAYGTFSAANRTTRTLDAHEARMQNATCASAALQNDLRSAVRPFGGESGKNLWNGNECRFNIQSGENRKGLVHYRLVNAMMERTFTPIGKQSESLPGGIQKKSTAPVAKNVNSVSFSYYADGNWQNRLRPKQWPEAVRIAFRFKEQGGSDFLFRQIVRLEVR